jgi:hypothetical protein
MPDAMAIIPVVVEDEGTEKEAFEALELHPLLEGLTEMMSLRQAKDVQDDLDWTLGKESENEGNARNAQSKKNSKRGLPDLSFQESSSLATLLRSTSAWFEQFQREYIERKALFQKNVAEILGERVRNSMREHGEHEHGAEGHCGCGHSHGDGEDGASHHSHYDETHSHSHGDEKEEEQGSHGDEKEEEQGSHPHSDHSHDGSEECQSHHSHACACHHEGDEAHGEYEHEHVHHSCIHDALENEIELDGGERRGDDGVHNTQGYTGLNPNRDKEDAMPNAHETASGNYMRFEFDHIDNEAKPLD